MLINLRPARGSDYGFARDLYVETISPYANKWANRSGDVQQAAFAALWRPEDTRVIQLEDRTDIGWVEVKATGDEVFLKHLFVAPAYQRQGIGSSVMRMLVKEWHPTGKPITLFVFENNPAVRLYERFDFTVSGKFDHQFLMRCDVPAPAEEAEPDQV